MGGKKKGSGPQPRTKDNMKPSSSEKAAQFLIQQTGSLGLPSTLLSPNLFEPTQLSSAFSDTTEPVAPTKVPGLIPVPQDPDASKLEPRLLSALKRLEKRDATTKQKALKDLIDLLDDSGDDCISSLDTSAVIAVLPFWPRIYCRLAVDENHKVRELTQSAMGRIARRVGRELGPYIKQLLPLWAFSTVDLHEPAGALAVQGIKETFPGSKRLQAYRVCAQQILDLIEHKVTEQFGSVLDESPPSARDPKVKGKGLKEGQSVDNKAPSTSSDSSTLQMAACIRFIASLVNDFSLLSDNNPCLVRFRKYLSPSALWTTISVHIREHILRNTSKDGRCLIGYSPAVHSAIYRLSTAMCTQSVWCAWLSSTEEGRKLATYLCTSIVAQLGFIGNKTGKLPLQTPCFIPAPLTVGLPGFGCYAQAWEAALACLTYLPSSLVWSVVNWHMDVCIPLQQLIEDGEIGCMKQIYPNLLCLLSRLPLDYEHLSAEERSIIESFFIDSALKGLERTLVTRTSLVDSSLGQTTSMNVPLSVDPSLPVVVVTGILECARFLIDRLTVTLDQESTPDPLCLRILDDVILRLLADAMHVVRCEAPDHVYLVCIQPPLVRKAFLEALFNQVSSLFINLARAQESGSKFVLFNRLRNELLRWISETPVSMASVSVQSFTDSEYLIDHTHLGLLDSLRLTQFVDCLAMMVFNQSISKASINRINRVDTRTRPINYHKQQSGTLKSTTSMIVQNTWCVDLLTQMCERIEALFTLPSLDPLVETSFYIAYLCISSYLPDTIEAYVLDIEHKLFTFILPTVSDDLLPIFFSDSVVRGLARSWSKSLELTVSSTFPGDISRHRFVLAVLPTLVHVLPVESPLFRRVFDLCVNCALNWMRDVISCQFNPDSLSLADISNLFSLVHSNVDSENLPLVKELRHALFPALLSSLRKHLPGANLFDLSHISAPLLRNMSILCVVALEELCPSGKLPLVDDINEHIQDLWTILLRLLLTLYIVQHFALVASVLEPDCELASLVSLPPTVVSPSGGHDEVSSPRTLCSLSLSSLISKIERMFLTSSELISYLSFDIFFDCVLRTAVHNAYLPAQLILFAESFMQHHSDRKNSDIDRALREMWLSAMTEIMLAVVDKVIESGWYTSDDECPPPRPILFPAGLLSLRVASPLSKLFRLWKLGSHLHFTSTLGPVQSDRWVRHIYCLAILRGGLASLSEPLDPIVTFSWPFCSNALESDTNNQVQTYNVSSSDGYLEPTRSAFTSLESTAVAQLGLSWHLITKDVSLSFLCNLFLPTCVQRYLPQLTVKQLGALCSLFNATCLNRLRSIHPNYWDRSLKLAATCTDDSNNPDVSWLDEHVRSQPDQRNNIKFNRLCEVEIPVGIVRRCLPRQELLGRIKCLSLIDTSADVPCGEQSIEPLDGHRVLQLATSLASVHVVSPVYVTTFLTILTSDYQKWLAHLADAGNSCVSDDLVNNKPGLLATLASMGFFESLLLLWQPWQWYVDATSKSTAVQQIGLIQLSMRLKQLRPTLTRNEWDFILCLIISWVCLVAEHTNQCDQQSKRGPMYVTSVRAFRVAAALGAIFIERADGPVSLDTLVILPTKSSKPTRISSTLSEWETELDGDLLDNDDNGEDTDDDFEDHAHRPDNDEVEPAKNQSSEFKTTEDGLLLELGSEQDWLVEDEQPLPSIDEDMNDGSEPISWSSVRNFIPHKGRPPVQIREDWEKFFSNHLYSVLLPVVFRTCLPVESRKRGVSPLASRLSQSICAAFATCPISQLLRLLAAQPHLIVEHLIDLDRFNVSGPQLRIKQLMPIVTDPKEQLTTSLRACLDLGAKLIRCSPIQSGQLLGHVILSRVMCLRTRSVGSRNTIRLSNYLLSRIPTSWLLGLYGSLPDRLERDLISERVLTDWGRGSSVLSYLVRFSVHDGWYLDVDAHQQLLSYLLSWDCLLTMLTSAGPEGRARMQRALLGPSVALFDRFLLCLGLLLSPPGSLETLVEVPSRLEPDERLLLPVSAARTDLIAAMSLRRSTHQRLRRPMRLAVPVVSGDDQEWYDPFSPDDRLLYLPGNRLARDISHMAVRLLRRFLSEAPALMRGWISRLSAPSGTSEEQDLQQPTIASFSDEETSASTSDKISSPLCGQRSGRLRQLASTIDKLISRYFSPGLARDEVLLVQYKAQLREIKGNNSGPDSKSDWFKMFTAGGPVEVGSVSIRSRPASREVIATYQVTEEHSMEMLIQLPDNYPLGLVTVSCGRGVGISQQQWHMRTIQLSIFINNQNGSILDGIDLWQKNVRKTFEGVEECAICYSVVHNTNFSLPKMQCRTCHKLFHYACMYRWFTTSHNPACPLCRHQFF